ncbi:MAG TPA: serine hydrolase, partial [Polyangiaceae bacterium]
MREGGVAPLVAAGWAARRAGSWREGTGGADDVLFDLASVTKPVLAVALARSGLRRVAKLGEYVKEARGTPTGDLPVELFLAHRAGLDAHVKLYEPLLRGAAFVREDAFFEAARARRADAGEATESGFPPVYSDLGYLLAGEALARFARAVDPDEVLAERVIAPLGLEGQLGSARQLEARGLDLRAIAAPTEDVPWRGGVIVGRVHDENAWALSPTGAPGHAGLFG